MREWRIDASSRELHLGDRRVRLSEKPFLVLEALVEARGGVVTRDELRKRLWTDDTFVDFENNLNSAVATLRQAFGDSARKPRFIETIPRVGYRLVPSAAPRRRVRIALAGALAAVALATGWFLREPGAPSSMRKEARAELERGLYLRGQFEARRDEERLLTEALASIREARRLDPAFGLAAAEEAETLLLTAFSGVLPFRTALEKARDASKEALRLTPSNGTALRVSGMAALFLEWDVSRAEELLRRAKGAGDDARTALAEATLLAVEGRYDEAIRAAERAVTLDPEAFYVRADLALFYLAAARNEEAAEATRRVLDVAPEFVPALSYGVLAYERLARFAEAAEAARTLMRLQGAGEDERRRVDRAAPKEAVALYRRWDLERVETLASGRADELALSLALRYAIAGDRAAALDHLERAYRSREALLIFLPAFPELAALHGDPRFEELSERLRRG